MMRLGSTIGEVVPRDPRFGKRKKPRSVGRAIVCAPSPSQSPIPDIKAFMSEGMQAMKLELFEQIRGVFNNQDDLRRAVKDHEGRINFLEKAIAIRSASRKRRIGYKTTLPALRKRGAK